MNRNDSPTSLVVDSITATLLVDLAKMWVSQEEALRSAIEQAAAAMNSPKKEDRLEAFNKLQRSLGLTPNKAADWQSAIRESRR